MGYFSNGTEGEMYVDAFCSRCVHGQNNDCPVWDAHLFWSYELCNAKEDPGKQMLDMFIPPREDHLGNRQCTMFVAKAADADLFPEGGAQ